MKKELIVRLHKTFEDHAHHEDGVEFWFARELQELLGYSKWENFEQVIAKAKIACTNSGYAVQDHFPDVRKMVGIGSGTFREISDIALDRYACYLIAQNGDPRKPEIAFAMTYFAVQTRKQKEAAETGHSLGGCKKESEKEMTAPATLSRKPTGFLSPGRNLCCMIAYCSWTGKS